MKVVPSAARAVTPSDTPTPTPIAVLSVLPGLLAQNTTLAVDCVFVCRDVSCAREVVAVVTLLAEGEPAKKEFSNQLSLSAASKENPPLWFWQQAAAPSEAHPQQV